MTRTGVPTLPFPRALARPESGESAPDISEIFRQHFDFVWRALRSLGVPPAGVDDAVQDVFVTVHRRLSEFRGESALRTWLYAITYRVACNHRRSARRRSAEPLPGELACPAPGPRETLQDAEASRFVREFLDQVSAERRDVFVLCVLDGLSAPEASEVLGVKLNTVYSRIRLVRAEFRQALAQLARRERCG